MSTLKVNKIQSYSGDTVIITNDTVVTGSVTATEGFIGSLTGTATNATTATTAISASIATNAINAISASIATTATNAISASIATTALTALTAITATTAATASNIAPAIGSDGVNRILTSDGDGTVTAEANLTFNGSNLTILGSTTSSGDISFTTSGSGIIQTLTKVIPNGTASYAGFSNTTASLNFGLNLITVATSASYCAKLPQPVTGKSVTVINKSGIELKLFPSNVGGDINGITNGFIIIPSDGRSYVFNCYENPLPGGWSVVTQDSTTTILSSGVISSSLNGWLNPTDQPYVWSFINQNYQATGSGASMNTHYSFLNYNQYGIVGPNQVGYINYSPNGAGSWILPSNPGTLTSIKIITNLKYDTNYFQIGLSINGRKLFLDHATINNVANPISAWAYVNTSTDSGYATWRDNTWLPWIAQNPGNTPYAGIDVNDFTSMAHYPYANVTTTSTPGTFIPGPGVSGSILAANPGDPGTMILNLDMTIPIISNTNDTFPSFTNLGVTSFPGAFVNSSNQLIDAFWVKDFGITLQNMNWNNYYPDLKIIPQYTFSI